MESLNEYAPLLQAIPAFLQTRRSRCPLQSEPVWWRGSASYGERTGPDRPRHLSGLTLAPLPPILQNSN